MMQNMISFRGGEVVYVTENSVVPVVGVPYGDDQGLLTKATTIAVSVTRWGWQLYDQRGRSPY
jgi:hypothetical protein